MTQKQYADAYKLGFDQTVRFLLSRGVLADPAEEAAQGAWAKGWECRGQLRDPQKLLTWVNTIAFNLFRDGCRRRETSEFPPEIPVPAKASPRAIDLARIFDKCNPAERDILQKHYLAGYTSQELAAQGGCKASTVRVRLLRLRRRLQTIVRAKRVPGKSASAAPSAFGHDPFAAVQGT